MSDGHKNGNFTVWWRRPGLGVCYSVEYQPGWSWDRNFVHYNREFTGKDGRLIFRGPYWKSEDWVGLSEKLGVDYHMGYAKFHDGICFYPSQHMDWCAPHDYVGDFASASRAAGIPVVFYYSVIFDHNPIFDAIQPRKWSTWSSIGDQPEYVAYLLKQYEEFMERYRPDAMWFDWYVENTAATRATIDFFREKYPDTVIAFNQSHNSARAARLLGYTSWEGHVLSVCNEYTILQNNVRPSWKPIARFLDPVASRIIMKFKKSTWLQANQYRREFSHPWELVSPAGRDWHVPELRSDPHELARMAAVTLACGGRSNLYMIILLDGSIRTDHQEQVESVFAWYRPRRHLFRDASPIRYEGDHPPGISGLPKGYGAIASRRDQDVLLHLIRLDGAESPTSIAIDTNEWPSISEIQLEPDQRSLAFNTTEDRITLCLDKSDIDPVDTIIRLRTS